MEDLRTWAGTSLDFVEVLPETLEEAEELAASIERAVQYGTSRGVSDLSVQVNSDGVMLLGHCRSYYTKQLAQHAAMSVPGGDNVINCIEVA